MSKNSKKNQAAAREQKRDWAWQRERDEDVERDNEIPVDEYQGMDQYAHEVKEFRS